MSSYKLEKVLQEILQDENIINYSEAEIKSLIQKILYGLGWDALNPKEVKPEYSIENYKVDLVLLPNRDNKVFIEIKKPSKNLGKYEEQLLKYAFKEGVNLAILTNGLDWWFYLPLMKGRWKDRNFLKLNIKNDDINFIISSLQKYLSKNQVYLGDAFKDAKKFYTGEKIKKILPEIINNIIKDNPQFKKMIVDEIIKKHEYGKEDIDINLIDEFLKNICLRINENIIKISSDNANLIGNSNNNPNSKKIFTLSERKDFTNTKIISFFIDDKEIYVNTWKEFFTKLVEILIEKHPEKIEKLLNLRGRRRIYFSKSMSDLRNPIKLNNVNIYIETHFSANYIAKLIKDILNIFNYPNNSIKIKIENSEANIER